MAETRWYPSKTGALADEDVFNAHRQAFDQIYDLHDKLKVMTSDLQTKIDQVNKIAAAANNGLQQQQLNTKINGFSVTNTIPTNGQTLKYNATTGQIEWV